MTAYDARLKVESHSADAVQALVNHILDAYEGYSSPILQSQPSGWHAFINIKLEVRR